MIVERIKTPYLSIFSYFVADEGQAVVIDPRRDIDVYLELARKHNKKIVAILETHRHEDYILGSAELAEHTGATICRSAYEDLGYENGIFLNDGDSIRVGGLELEALHTPGHTKGHMAYVLYRREQAYMVFSGDALFYGDLGRTDFYGEDKLEEMTGMAYDSLQKILSLGDGVILMPAHGPGSACGAAIVDIPYSTLGHEKETSPVFAPENREDFIKTFGVMHFKPPYFTKVEVCNVKGTDFLGNTIEAQALEMVGLLEAVEGKTIVDARPISSFSYHHLPKAIFVGSGMLSKAMGSLVSVDDEVVLVTDGLSQEDADTAYWTLRRMGFDKIIGTVGDGVHLMLEANGQILEKEPTLSADEFAAMNDADKPINIDVRSPKEIGDEKVPFERINIPLEELPERIGEIKENEFLTSCYTGIRALVGASYLKAQGKKGTHVKGNLNTLS